MRPLLASDRLFDNIELVDETLLKAKSIHFKETVCVRSAASQLMESLVLSLTWEDNLLVKQVDAVVSQNREIMMMKSALESGIQRKDEILLLKILAQLKVRGQ